MLRTDESETEILLGNKQLFGIFIVVALLLGIAFTGGYMVGRGSAPKKAAETATGPAEPTAASASAATPTGGETHSVSADGSDTSGSAGQSDAAAPEASVKHEEAAPAQETPLGSRKRKNVARTQPPEDLHTGSTANTEDYVPQHGKTYLQVMAVSRDEAFGIADVLHRKGFRAHAVPSPGNAKLYRVIIGPMRDAGDLSNTRDALHKTGFRDVFVQKY